MKTKQLYDKIEAILRKYPETRNCDATLVAYLWREFYPQHAAVNVEGMTDYFDIKAIIELGGKLAKFESIRRGRQIIQNDEGRFLPTSWAVAKGRRIERDKWLAAMQNVPRNVTILDN